MAKAPVKALNLTFSLEKETPGALRYRETNADGGWLSSADGAAVGSLYVRKTAFGDSKPKSLKVAITVE